MRRVRPCRFDEGWASCWNLGIGDLGLVSCMVVGMLNAAMWMWRRGPKVVELRALAGIKLHQRIPARRAHTALKHQSVVRVDLKLAQVNSRWQKGVCTMCTPWSGDRFVHRPDRTGLRMFPGEGRICEGRSPVRVPPRAQCFPCSGACGPLSVHKLFTCGPLRGPFFGGRCRGLVAPSPGSGSVAGSSWNHMTC